VGPPAVELEVKVEVEDEVEGALVLVAPTVASPVAACAVLVAGVGAVVVPLVDVEVCELTPHAARTEAVAPPTMSLTSVRRFIPNDPLCVYVFAPAASVTQTRNHDKR
jgi:hypothetical protein